MKKTTQTILIFAGFYLLCGGMFGVFAQQINDNYKKLMKTDGGALSAAKFAVKQENRRLSLASIERAESQIVAGTNYKICMKVINNGKIEDVTAVVSMNPKNKFSLIGWQKGVCEIVNN